MFNVQKHTAAYTVLLVISLLSVRVTLYGEHS